MQVYKINTLPSITMDRGLKPSNGSKHGINTSFTNSRNVSPLTCPSYIPTSSEPSLQIIGIAVIRGPQGEYRLLILARRPFKLYP
jgi:hypothetical protein